MSAPNFRGRHFLFAEEEKEYPSIGLDFDKEKRMDTRVALIGIVVEDTNAVEEINHLLSTYGEYIIGRMGVPYREKGISIISVTMDAPNDVISALSGKLGMLPGVSSKTIFAKYNKGKA